MKQQRDGIGARAATPPPPDREAKDVFPESHVARSASSNPTLEINRTLELNLNDLELVDELPPHLQDLVKQAFGSTPPPLPPERAAQYSPTSEAPFQVPVRSEPPRRRSYVPIAIAGAVVTFAIGGVARLLVPSHAAPGEGVRAAAQLPPSPVSQDPVTSSVPLSAPDPVTTAPTTSTTPVLAPVVVPVVEVIDLPKPRVGTITGSPGHRLWIDGTLATGWQQSVTCGPHTVQVGSGGASRTVDVPCGGGINVSP